MFSALSLHGEPEQVQLQFDKPFSLHASVLDQAVDEPNDFQASVLDQAIDEPIDFQASVLDQFINDSVAFYRAHPVNFGPIVTMGEVNNGNASSPGNAISPLTGNPPSTGNSPNNGNGSNGQNGANGFNGANGANGHGNRVNGVSGTTGSNGSNGFNGHGNGANGVNGANGSNGNSFNGSNGSNGRTPLPRASGSDSPDHFTESQIRRASERAREMINGPDAESDRILRWALERLCERINAEPNTYIMTNCERTVLTLFQHHFPGNELVRRAIARYWANPPPRSPPNDDAASPDSMSSGERERAREAIRVQMAGPPELAEPPAADEDEEHTPSPPDVEGWSNPNSSERKTRG